MTRDVEGDAWDDFWCTDAAGCCSCPSCNYYAPDYEAHKDEPCLLRTIIERIIAARLAAAAANAEEVSRQRTNRIALWRDLILDPDREPEPLGPSVASLLDSFEADVRADAREFGGVA